MNKPLSKNPWQNIYPFLLGEQEMTSTLSPTMMVLYNAIRDFTAHFSMYDTNTPTRMYPHQELPLLLSATHQMELAETPEDEAELAIANSSVSRLDFLCGNEVWDPCAEPLNKFVRRMYPQQIRPTLRQQRNEKTLIQWRKLYQSAKDRHPC